MNKVEKYINWCVDELMDSTVIHYGYMIATIKYNGHSYGFNFSCITKLNKNMDKLVVPYKLFPILDGMGLYMELYTVVFGKYITKISFEIESKYYSNLYLAC